MPNNTIKIGFEITDTWIRQEFRELLRLILYNPTLVCETPDTDFELYIISTDSTTYMNKVASVINSWYPDTVLIPAANIIVCNFNSDKVTACTNNNIDIYFDADNRAVIDVEVNTTDTYPVLVRTEADRYNAKQKYITEFQNVLKDIIREEQG